jgi:tetratricopeptide (TPR) repeat protein
MKTNIKQQIKILLILLLSCSFLFTTGCSGLRDWWGYDASTSQMRGNNYVFANSDLNQFYSSVRPVDGNVESDYRLARYFQKRGKHKFAVDELLNAIRKDPSFIKAYNALGVSYDHLGHFDLAAKSYKFALQLNPELDYVHNNLGYSYLLNGDLDAAIDAFRKAIALDGTNKRYHSNLGLAYVRKGQTDLAFDEFKLADDESSAQNKTARLFKDQKLSVAPKEATVETLPEGITPYDDIPKDTAKPLLLAGNAQLIVSENPEFRLIPDDLAGIDLSEKTIEYEVKQSNLPQKIVAETKAPLSYTVQVSASKNFVDATHVIKMLANQGYPCPYLNRVGNKNAFYRVRLGSFLDKKEADQWLSDLNHTLGNKPFIAFEDEQAKKIVLTTGKQECFYAKDVASTVIQLLDIEISNGNGVRHMARNVGIYLNPKGFRTTRLTNADHFNYPETKIYYKKGYRQAALRLAEEIPGRQEDANVIELDQIKRRAIKVLIGKDIVPFNDLIVDNLKSNPNIAKVENASKKQDS